MKIFLASVLFLSGHLLAQTYNQSPVLKLTSKSQIDLFAIPILEAASPANDG